MVGIMAMESHGTSQSAQTRIGKKLKNCGRGPVCRAQTGSPHPHNPHIPFKKELQRRRHDRWNQPLLAVAPISPNFVSNVNNIGSSAR